MFWKSHENSHSNEFCIAQWHKCGGVARLCNIIAILWPLVMLWYHGEWKSTKNAKVRPPTRVIIKRNAALHKVMQPYIVTLDWWLYSTMRMELRMPLFSSFEMCHSILLIKRFVDTDKESPRKPHTTSTALMGIFALTVCPLLLNAVRNVCGYSHPLKLYFIHFLYYVDCQLGCKCWTQDCTRCIGIYQAKISWD
jgi:hypothetical protein